MIALVRLDKIGDLVSTLPVDELLIDKQAHWVISKGLGFLPQYADPAREFTEISQSKSLGVKELVEFIHLNKPEAAVIFYAPWWVSYTFMKEGVPVRIGRKSQWHSFLFLTDSLRQSRSKSENHEADYNFELMQFALGKLGRNGNPDIKTAPVLKLNPPKANRLLERFDIKSKQFVVVHPGMAGSALNWPQAKWNELIGKLVQKTKVVITGTEADEPWLTEIKPKWELHPQVRIVQNKLDRIDLLSLLNLSKGLIAPSTGVLHLGASLDLPVIGIFPPLPSQHPKRWGPRGHKSVDVFSPSVDCPAKVHCLKEKCSQYNCMQLVDVNLVFETVQKKMDL
jgi:heptosyltransferase I